ncbi:enoyl-CoA hydratase/isomerase family protein [Sediminibacillus albus]|uniref:Enoyl-CoA hydratase/carnithine racemase n=1 Tax=Sediminibacillus albus TaxID=407036 RepID=A0A1G8W870_9BACI|nr:enoyl-CoA hydratase/isomerase family protein [Sediminibacillus albus]SDJ74469.1 Enoyl-CoA hydratase/carnithine racemase [Sediminibacillus albus]
MSFETIEYQVEKENYAHIRLNRPERRNAVSIKMTEELEAAVELAEKETFIKCLVISSTGSNVFCAGGDLRDLHSDLTKEEAFQLLNRMRQLLYRLFTFPLPTICVLNGDGFGGGCEIASACDERISHSGTRFGYIQSTLGITPGWGGGALLYQRISPDNAYHWLVTGEIYGTAELSRIGWLHRIVDQEEMARPQVLLDAYLNKSSRLLRLLKKQYMDNINLTRLKDKMKQEVKNCASLWDSVEHVNAVEAFLHHSKK